MDAYGKSGAENGVGFLMDGSNPKNAEFEPIEVGGLCARLALSDADVDAAQALRYRVFYEEMAAKASAEVSARQRDFDQFDGFCDHLLVIDRDRSDIPGGVVGTYRLLRRSVADANCGFYSVDEYDISRLVAFPGEILELGRSCVDAANRNRPTMQILWRAIAEYIRLHDIPILFGCASLPGTDPQKLALPLAYLYHYHLAPPALRAVAVPERYVDMRLMQESEVDHRRALSELPPLIKGYLRLGGFVGDGAVIDWQFNTTDVSILVKTDLITDKYAKHYERSSRKSAPE